MTHLISNTLVTQGSALGPETSQLYINDICKVPQMLRFVLLAENISRLGSGGELEQIVEGTTTGIHKLKKECYINKIVNKLG